MTHAACPKPGSDANVGAQSDALVACLQLERLELEQIERVQARRRLIVTRWVEGKLAREIGEELGISKNHVTAEMVAIRRAGIPLAHRASRGRRRLRVGQLALPGDGRR